MSIDAPPELPALRPEVEAIVEDAIAVRREIHHHAELSTEEWRTQELILNWLRGIGADDVRAAADTGATALITGSKPGPNILWRADIDALPLFEETGLPFASEREAMHACGHDGHTAIALAMASLLQRSRDRLAGSVRFAFQPAEEHVGGAARMVREGIMEDPHIDRVFGLHIWAPLPAGEVRVVAGAVFAAATHFRIIIRGRGGHASAPQDTVDPIVVAAHCITALQTIVSRNLDAAQTAVVTIGRIQGGSRGNIIPSEVMMSGTIRTFERDVRDLIVRRMDTLLAGVTSAWGATHQLDTSTIEACVNDESCACLVRDVAADFVGEARVGEQRITGADDMAHFLEAAPGAYFLLGGRPLGQEHVYAHHHPKFDFDERCIGIGIELGLRIIEAATGSRTP